MITYYYEKCYKARFWYHGSVNQGCRSWCGGERRLLCAGGRPQRPDGCIGASGGWGDSRQGAHAC